MKKENNVLIRLFSFFSFCFGILLTARLLLINDIILNNKIFFVMISLVGGVFLLIVTETLITMLNLEKYDIIKM